MGGWDGEAVLLALSDQPFDLLLRRPVSDLDALDALSLPCGRTVGWPGDGAGWVCHDTEGEFTARRDGVQHVAPDHLVADQLAVLRTEWLDRTVESMAGLIDAPNEPWFVTRSRTEIAAVLSDGLRSPIPATQRLAAETINRLVARGFMHFAELL
jgi:hypothetical protein